MGMDWELVAAVLGGTVGALALVSRLIATFISGKVKPLQDDLKDEKETREEQIKNAFDRIEGKVDEATGRWNDNLSSMGKRIDEKVAENRVRLDQLRDSDREQWQQFAAQFHGLLERVSWLEAKTNGIKQRKS